VLKQAINLTRSKNRTVVKVAYAHLGLCYFAGLLLLWHIPLLSVEIGIRLY